MTSHSMTNVRSCDSRKRAHTTNTSAQMEAIKGVIAFLNQEDQYKTKGESKFNPELFFLEKAEKPSNSPTNPRRNSTGS